MIIGVECPCCGEEIPIVIRLSGGFLDREGFIELDATTAVGGNYPQIDADITLTDKAISDPELLKQRILYYRKPWTERARIKILLDRNMNTKIKN